MKILISKETILQKEFDNSSIVKIDNTEYIQVESSTVSTSKSSKIRIKVECSYCSSLYETSLGSLNRIKGKPCCKNCSSIKRKETNLDRYGVDNISQLESTKEKKKETAIAKYGVDHFMKTEEGKDKIKKVFLEHFGVDNPLKNNTIKAKVRESWDSKSKEELQDIAFKRENTNIERLGVPYPSQNKKVKDKIIATNIDRTGYSNPFKNPEVLKKRKETCLGKYGAETFVESLDFKKNRYYNMQIFSMSQEKTLLTPLEDFSSSDSQKGLTLKFQCNKCNTVFDFYLNNSFVHDEGTIDCPNCPSQKGSKEEREVLSFIKKILPEEKILSNIRILDSNKEIDIYLPNKNIGFEYNGIVWHSEIFGRRDRDYHIAKLNDALDKNIKLFSIYDYEWKEKRDIVESIIKAKLGIIENKVFARKCRVDKVETLTAKTFFNSNHIQGFSSGKVYIGLFYKEELVSCISFSKPRYSKEYEWEILRFANKLNTQVIGGFSKMLTYFEKNYSPSSIITYSDYRLFNSNVYEKSGFVFSHISKPNYFYIKNGSRVGSRHLFQKHKLYSILPSFNPDLSEWENMKANGYDRVWDCGNRVFIKNYI